MRASATLWNISPSSSSSRSRALKLSMDPFSHELPSSIYAVAVPIPPIQLLTASATNSAP
jgi:hypothetical protein